MWRYLCLGARADITCSALDTGESGFKKTFSFSEPTVARALVWSCPYQSRVSPTGWGAGTALTRGELLLRLLQPRIL